MCDSVYIYLLPTLVVSCVLLKAIYMLQSVYLHCVYTHTHTRTLSNTKVWLRNTTLLDSATFSSSYTLQQQASPTSVVNNRFGDVIC